MSRNVLLLHDTLILTLLGLWLDVLLFSLGPKSTEETISLGFFEERSRQTRDSQVEFGH